MILPKLLLATAAIGAPVAMSGHTDATIGTTDLLMQSSLPLGSDETTHSAGMIGSGYGTTTGTGFIQSWKNETTPTTNAASVRRFATPDNATFTLNDTDGTVLSMVPYAGSRLFNRPINNRENSVAGTAFVNYDSDFNPVAENKVTLQLDGVAESIMHTGTALGPNDDVFYSIMFAQKIKPDTQTMELVNADGTKYNLTNANSLWNWSYPGGGYARLGAIVKYDARTLKPIDHLWMHPGNNSWQSYSVPSTLTANPDGTISVFMEGHVMGWVNNISPTGTNTCDASKSIKKKLVITGNLDTIQDCISRSGNAFWYEYTSKSIPGPTNREALIGVTAIHGSRGDFNSRSHYKEVYDNRAGFPAAHTMSIPYIAFMDSSTGEYKNGTLFSYMHNNYATGSTNEGQASITDFEDIVFSPDNQYLYALMSSGTVPTADADAPAELKTHNGGVDMYLFKYKVADLEAGTPAVPEVINIGGTKDDYGRGLIFENGTNDLLVYGDVMSKNGTFASTFIGKNDTKFDTAIIRVKTNATDFKIVQTSSIQTVGETLFPTFVSVGDATYFSVFTKDAALQDGIPNAGGDVVVGSLVSIIKTEQQAANANQLFGYDVKDILPLWRKRPDTFANYSGYEDVDRDGALDSYLEYIKWKAEKIHTSRIAVTASAFGVSTTEVLRTVSTKQELEQFILNKNAETGKEFKLPSITEEDHEAIEAEFGIHRTNMLVEFMQNNALLLIGAGAFVALYMALIILNKKHKEISEIESN